MTSKQEKLIDLAVKVHLAEYDRMVKEITVGLEWHKSLVQYSLLFIGSSVTAINFFPQVRELYLIASLILSAIGWTFTEQSYKMLLFGRYINNQLRPKVNNLLRSAGGSRDPVFDFWGFDQYFRQGDLRTVFAGVPAVGKFAVSVLPGLLFAVAYWISSKSSFAAWSQFEKTFFFIAVIIGLAPIISGLITLPFFIRHSK